MPRVRYTAEHSVGARKGARTDWRGYSGDESCRATHEHWRYVQGSWKRLSIPILGMYGLSGCAATLRPSAFEGGVPEMRPEVFFAGTTTSSGVQESRGGAPTRRFQVKGVGQALPDGQFRLEQTITFEQDAPTTRTFTFRRIDAHHYVGTLTGASGAVRGEAYGNLFHLRYPMKHPYSGRMEQWLYLQPDGRTVLNEATIRVFGIVGARLSERITREKP